MPNMRRITKIIKPTNPAPKIGPPNSPTCSGIDSGDNIRNDPITIIIINIAIIATIEIE